MCAGGGAVLRGEFEDFPTRGGEWPTPMARLLVARYPRDYSMEKEHGVPPCYQPSPRTLCDIHYVCTREEGHRGPHVGHWESGSICCWWEDACAKAEEA